MKDPMKYSTGIFGSNHVFIESTYANCSNTIDKITFNNCL